MVEKPVRTEMPNEIELSIVNKFRRPIWTKFLKGIKEYDLIQGSTAFVQPVVGLIIAGEGVKDPCRKS